MNYQFTYTDYFKYMIKQQAIMIEVKIDRL
jgi:hypothetical protein